MHVVNIWQYFDNCSLKTIRTRYLKTFLRIADESMNLNLMAITALYSGLSLGQKNRSTQPQPNHYPARSILFQR